MNCVLDLCTFYACGRDAYELIRYRITDGTNWPVFADLFESHPHDSFEYSMFPIQHIHNRRVARHTSFPVKWIQFVKIHFHTRCVQVLASWTMRGMFFFGSFHRIKVSGRQVSSKEAPILALAPHSSFFDSIAVVSFGPPSVLAKAETAFLPFFGSEFTHFGMNIFQSAVENRLLRFAELINFTQPIYVWREDPNSRQNTIKTVIERANSKDNWPQVIIVKHK